MILAIECVVGCILFGAFIILSVLKNQKAWICVNIISIWRRVKFNNI